MFRTPFWHPFRVPQARTRYRWSPLRYDHRLFSGNPSGCIESMPDPLSARWRQKDRKSTPFTDFAFDGDGSVMSFDYVFHQRQAQATTLHIMNESVAHPVKLLENFRLFSA